MTTSPAPVGPASVSERTPCVFVPVPLVTGNTVVTGDGVPHGVASVQVVITTDEGREVMTALEWRYGGWWAPPL